MTTNLLKLLYNTTILVTSGAGFIGSNTCEVLFDVIKNRIVELQLVKDITLEVDEEIL
jgi:UDP-glucose 4-epimerase